MEALTGNDGKWVIPATEWFTTQHIDTQITEALQSHQPVTVSTSLFTGDLAGHTRLRGGGDHGNGQRRHRDDAQPVGRRRRARVIQMRLGDLIGTNPLGGLGLGPTAMINIGQI